VNRDIHFHAGDREVLRLHEDGRITSGKIEIGDEEGLCRALRSWFGSVAGMAVCPACGHTLMLTTGEGSEWLS